MNKIRKQQRLGTKSPTARAFEASGGTPKG